MAGVVLIALLGLLLSASLVQGAPPLSGAIFTTTVDGTVVNENVHYEAKEDVYLDGGPGPRAPSGAAGLPQGDYYFQVTDPSGKTLLSTDHISCRRIHVNEHGVIDFVYPGTNYVWQAGRSAAWVAVACQHAQGVDVDHAELGAITVQLYPYLDTPNPGGVYKVWVTRTEDYAGDPVFVPVDRRDAVNGAYYAPGYYHGFIPSKSKTDNYKVRKRGRPCDPDVIQCRKFHDRNINGVQDVGEEDVSGWAVEVTEPSGVTNTLWTPFSVTAAELGTYTFVESTPAGTIQTMSALDGVLVSLYPDADPSVSVDVTVECSGAARSVVYGNVGAGTAEACKVYDRDGDGNWDEGEPTVPGFLFEVCGTDVTGASVALAQATGEDGCTTFDLLPGTYGIAEIFPDGSWEPTGDSAAVKPIVIESILDPSGAIGGTSVAVVFTNVCKGTADFGTKGYWHNKNGLEEITPADLAYVNGLDPYDSPTDYFGAGDEPFDGLFMDGTPVDAAKGDWGEEVAPAGSPKAEVSHFLVDANAGGDPREQLAQQLLAFIFNCRHRLDGTGAAVKLPGGTWMPAGSLIGQAIAVWTGGTDAERVSMAGLLDALNNCDAVEFIRYVPCTVSYPG